jgi:protein-S-isoprenylcysteine O-methyltransferase Ste14
MKTLEHAKTSNAIHLIAGVLMAPLWSLFAYQNIRAFLITNEWSYLFICISETLCAAFFLIRTYPDSVSAAPFDWIVAVLGTFAPFFFVPTEWGAIPAARHAIVAGTVLTVLGMISLNRSFALVAAKREIKTSGMYRFVRHPLYASYLLAFTGYVLANTSLTNIVVYVFAMGCMFVRMLREEKHLALNDEYSKYMRQVRYRVIPLVF